MLSEIAVSGLVGSGLRERIQQLLDANNITPANALVDLQRVLDDVRQLDEIVTKGVDVFERLGIEAEDLRAGESEIGLLLPFSVIHSNLAGFQKEMHEFDRHLKILGELVEGNPESPKIRCVSSSLLQVFLESTPGIALCVATALERLCALYKQILEIRQLRKQLGEKPIPKKVITSIEEHEQQMAATEIEKIADALVKEFYKGKDKNREHELRNGVGAALRFFAEQIDEGVDMEVRSKPPRAKAVAESEGEKVNSGKTKKALEEARAIAARIDNAGAVMRALKRAKGPVLALQQPTKKRVKQEEE